MTAALRQRLRALAGEGAGAGRVRALGPVAGRRPRGIAGSFGPPPQHGGWGAGAGAVPAPARGLARLGFHLDEGVLVRRLVVRVGQQAAGGLDAVAPEVVALLAGDLAWAAADPAAVWYFDTETTGLAGGTGTIPFLYGWGRRIAGGMELEQWLLADLGAEELLVDRALRRLAGPGGVVTFNGTAYDLPLVRTRAILARRERDWRGPLHLDLLPLVRRLFGYRLRRCTLAEVERQLLAGGRSDDLAGSEVPERYRCFLRDGDGSHLAEVLTHNERDIVSLGRLLAVLGRQAAGAVQEPGDHLPLARFYEARGATASALRAYATALDVVAPPLDRVSARHHARLLRREGRPAEAAELWRMLWERWGDLEAAEALCVDHEWRRGDLEAALGVAERALGVAPPALADRFARRIGRLERRRGRGSAARRRDAGPAGSRAPAVPPPWSAWLPGGASYEAWQAARRRRAPATPGTWAAPTTAPREGDRPVALSA